MSYPISDRDGMAVPLLRSEPVADGIAQFGLEKLSVLFVKNRQPRAGNQQVHRFEREKSRNTRDLAGPLNRLRIGPAAKFDFVAALVDAFDSAGLAALDVVEDFLLHVGGAGGGGRIAEMCIRDRN